MKRAQARLLVMLCTPVCAATLLAAPAHAATTINLGTAGAFAVLAGSAITNSGPSTIVGKIGISPLPAETGLALCPAVGGCVTLTGTRHSADDIAAQAKQDLTAAYDAAVGQPSDQTIAADLEGMTFLPGVYRSASSLGLTGEVTLDGRNDPDAVFLFQAGSTLTTAVASSINLINGANACNVFFQVGSSATLGAASTFHGTILAHTSITLGDGVTVYGRLLAGEQASQEGAVTLLRDTITVPDCAGGEDAVAPPVDVPPDPDVPPGAGVPPVVVADPGAGALPAVGSPVVVALPESGVPTAVVMQLPPVVVEQSSIVVVTLPPSNLAAPPAVTSRLTIPTPAVAEDAPTISPVTLTSLPVTGADTLAFPVGAVLLAMGIGTVVLTAGPRTGQPRRGRGTGRRHPGARGAPGMPLSLR